MVCVYLVKDNLKWNGVFYLPGGDRTVTVQLDGKENTIRFIDPSRDGVSVRHTLL